MKNFAVIVSLLLFKVCSAQDTECLPLDSVENFDLDTYASDTWYIHQQAVTRYSPIEDNYCVRANYEVRSTPTYFGYTVDVMNRALTNNEDLKQGNLCAYQTDLEENIFSPARPSKLAVAPCFLPKFFAGPYWVVAYDEDMGYALVAGGQPTIPSYNETDGSFVGCKYDEDKTNNSGLWIFSRSYERDEDLIDYVRTKATDLGFDVSILNDVDQTDCGYEDTCSDTDEEFYVLFQGKKDCTWVGESPFWRCLFFKDKCQETCGQCDYRRQLRSFGKKLNK
jgi:lipocalin